jgi:hypothetical protein
MMMFKKYPGTLRTNTIVAHHFAIARYWELKWEQNQRWPLTPNFRDKTQPHFDTAGHALKVYAEIPKEDPKGALADDSVMAIANFHFLQKHWEEADHYYADLRKEYPKSEHQYHAHYFGLVAKLNTYQGADYDVSPLEEADKIAEQLQKQFDRELGDERDRISQARAEIEAQYALREFQMGEFYYNTHYYRSAKGHYENVIADWPNTRLAQEAQNRIAASKDKRPEPVQYFAWVSEVLPQSKREGPRLAVLPSRPPGDTTTASNNSPNGSTPIVNANGSGPTTAGGTAPSSGTNAAGGTATAPKANNVFR